jgi:alpha-tubulin suppressor-like RCC1 family protein
MMDLAALPRRDQQQITVDRQADRTRRMTMRTPSSCPTTPTLLALLAAVAIGCDDAEPPTVPDAHLAPGVIAYSRPPIPFREVSAGELHSCGVTTSDYAYCWGYNGSGQIGDNTYSTRFTPILVAVGWIQFRQVSAGYAHSCGVTPTNYAYCWGNNAHGQLGDGTTTNRPWPVQVAGGLAVRRIGAGERHTCATTTSNVAYCWGNNTWGQLGDGTTTRRTSPVQVTGGRSYRLVTAGGHHTCGVVPVTNAAYCWGWNGWGQLGDNSTTDRSVPVAVAGGRTFGGVSAGGYHSCGTGLSGSAYCWGRNSSGQLGDGTTSVRLAPALVTGSGSFLDVEAGDQHNCAGTTNNLAYCWGENFAGQLGDGTTTDRWTPTRVLGALTFRTPAAGSLHSCVATAAGAGAYCWGENWAGQVGDGTTTRRLSPVAVSP